MKLLTKELEKRFEKVGSQESVKNPIVIARFFNPVGMGNWYATEYNPETKLFFGYVSLFGDHNDEWGSFALSDLEEYRGAMGMKIERDQYSKEELISKVIPKAYIHE